MGELKPDPYEDRAAEMWAEDVRGLNIARYMTWQSLKEDYLGRRIVEFYLEVARKEVQEKGN